MATELDALLQAIREVPADDLPRLALSDWCMDQSDPATHARGEMIQLRVQAVALPLSSPERGAMEQRIQELRQQYESEWLGGLEPLLAGWDFERGMILIEVRSGKRADWHRLARQPGWKWVIGLKGVLLLRADVSWMVRSPLLENLTSLDLSDCELGAGIVNLFDSAALARLTSLRLGYTTCGDQGAELIAAQPMRLDVLALCNNAIGATGAQRLANSPHLRQLTHLDLSRNPLGEEGARALAHSTNLPALTHLALSSCCIGDRGGSAFVDSMQRQGLQQLDLSNNRFGKPTWRELHEHYGKRVVLGET